MSLSTVLSIRFLHKWLSLVIGLQVFIWVASGTLISVLDQKLVSGQVTMNAAARPELFNMIDSESALVPISDLISSTALNVSSVTLTAINQTLSFRLLTDNGPLFFCALTGRPLKLQTSDIERIAMLSYRGSGTLQKIDLLPAGSEELRLSHAVWRVQFDDAVATRVYVANTDGAVLAHRNRYWKVVDFLLMMHFMDYPRKHSFNNVQIIVVAFLSLWLALSGLLLVKSSFRRRDFSIRNLRR